MLLFLEPFYGGSHRAFADGLIASSRHAFDLVTLPAERWRRRIRTAALQFAERISRPEAYAGLVTTGLLSLADLKAAWGSRCPPVLLYMHESQLTYPMPKGQTLDTDTAVHDIRNAFFADRIVFNSDFHRTHFLTMLGRAMEQLPELAGTGPAESIAAKSTVLHPGVSVPGARELRDYDYGPGQREALARLEAARRPLVLWNHRWEYDKQPGRFFGVLQSLAAEELSFSIVVLGENPQYEPKEFLQAQERLRERIKVFGFEPDRMLYYRFLHEADIVVSTAIQENFGLAMVEAMALGCFPVLPRRLSYPELLPPAFRPRCLYQGRTGLARTLQRLITEGVPETEQLARFMHRYSWESLIPFYDEELDALMRLSSSPS